MAGLEQKISVSFREQFVLYGIWEIRTLREREKGKGKPNFFSQSHCRRRYPEKEMIGTWTTHCLRSCVATLLSPKRRESGTCRWMASLLSVTNSPWQSHHHRHLRTSYVRKSSADIFRGRRSRRWYLVPSLPEENFFRISSGYLQGGLGTKEKNCIRLPVWVVSFTICT